MIEGLLMTNREDCIKKDVDRALKVAQAPYTEIMEFYEGLPSVYEHHGGTINKKDC